MMAQAAKLPPQPAPHRPRINLALEGGQISTAASMWPRMEMKPETMLTGNPTVATLVSDIATPAGADAAARDTARLAARKRLSTYKVVRAVAEVEAIGFFDGINGYDNAFLSMGPCHWTMGRLIHVLPTPALPTPGPHTINLNRSWAVDGCRRLMPAEITNTMASGARMNSHFSGLTNIA